MHAPASDRNACISYSKLRQSLATVPMRITIFFAAIASLLAPIATAGADPAPSERVRRLLAEMTLEEKIGQLDMPSHGGHYDPARVAAGRTGGVLNFGSPQEIAAIRALNAQSRLKIPLIFGLDVIHGYRTLFPMPLAEAASFDPAVAEQSTHWAAVESRAAGLNLTFSPVADLARDPRWGRIVEGGGEDPMLAGLFAAARVRGFHSGGIGATLKHFAGYGAVEGGRDYAPADISEGTLRDRYLPPYRMAVEAGVDVVMTSYISLNGTPTTASRRLMSDILRGEWGFPGYVVSDMNAIPEIALLGVADGNGEAAKLALEAGVDQDMDGEVYIAELAGLVRDGTLPEAALDRAVARVLATKERLGLFDEKPFDPAAAASVLGRADIRTASRALAAETFVLLQNKDDVLPIRPETRSIAVVGALAASQADTLGNNAARAVPAETVTVLDGLRARAPAGTRIDFVEGCDTACTSDSNFQAAAAKAAEADLIVAVLGEPQDHSGEGASRASLELPGRQTDLLRRLAATGRPVVVVLLAGRPLALSEAVDPAAAILLVWYPGSEGGHAVAETLFGDRDPAGRLPVTFPRHVGQVPITYDALPTARPGKVEDRYTSRYLDVALGPLFPFGHGLGYTRFTQSDARIAARKLGPDDRLTVSVTVANAGTRPGREVVQLYVRDVVASRARPVRELKAFGKLLLEPGEAREVVLSVPVRSLGFHRDDGSYVVEPGRFDVYLGSSAAAPLIGSVTVSPGYEAPPAGLSAERFEAGHMTVIGKSP